MSKANIGKLVAALDPEDIDAAIETLEQRRKEGEIQKKQPTLRQQLLQHGYVEVRWVTLWHDDESRFVEPLGITQNGREDNLWGWDEELEDKLWGLADKVDNDYGVYVWNLIDNTLTKTGTAYYPDPALEIELLEEPITVQLEED